MTELQQTRYDRLMRRVGGLLGPGSKVSEVLSEIFPTVDVERVPGELLFLMGTRIAYGGDEQAGVVGENSKIQLFNPADSGILITVTGFMVASSAAVVVRWNINTTALATTTATGRVRDSRASGIGIPTGEIRRDTTIGATPLTGVIGMVANDPFTLSDENGIAVLAPGSGFEVGLATTNVSERCTFYWRERTALDSELSF